MRETGRVMHKYICKKLVWIKQLRLIVMQSAPFCNIKWCNHYLGHINQYINDKQIKNNRVVSLKRILKFKCHKSKLIVNFSTSATLHTQYDVFVETCLLVVFFLRNIFLPAMQCPLPVLRCYS